MQCEKRKKGARGQVTIEANGGKEGGRMVTLMVGRMEGDGVVTKPKRGFVKGISKNGQTKKQSERPATAK
jgi:hypothetical protein